MRRFLIKALTLVLLLGLIYALAGAGLSPRDAARLALFITLASSIAWIILGHYIVAPFRLYRTHRIQAPPEIIPVSDDGPELPEEIKDHLSESGAVFLRYGFDLVSTMFLPKPITAARAFLGLYVNRRTKETAKATFIVTTGKLIQQRRIVEYTTRFDDGFVINTNNFPNVNTLKPVPEIRTTCFPEVSDPQLLYELHRFMVRRVQHPGTPESRLDTKFKGDAVALVQSGMLEVFTKQIDTGYLARTEDGFRLTIKGAFVGCWKLSWPLKPLLLAQRRRLAQRLLEEFRAEAPAENDV